jgi:hypothetical protein
MSGNDWRECWHPKHFELEPDHLTGDPATAASLVQQQSPRFEAARLGSFTRALQAIVAGSRDRALANAPDLQYSMAAEILFLIETLEKPR